MNLKTFSFCGSLKHSTTGRCPLPFLSPGRKDPEPSSTDTGSSLRFFLTCPQTMLIKSSSVGAKPTQQCSGDVLRCLPVNEAFSQV
uniref:Uncharacterized protein n=1 Tax=Oryzias melastigma TaxID=30732 RepID=A0A3B3BJE6_ORYME